MDFALPDHVEALAAEARAVGEEWADPALPDDSWIIGHSREFALELARRDWLGMTWPVAMGGGGRDPIERFVVFEALISAGAPVAAAWFADRQIGPTLLRYGNDDQRREFLPEIVDGTSSWCIGMSEPNAGSDVASLRTRAEPEGKGWRVNGTKVWTSGAQAAKWCYLVCRTEPDAPQHRGLSELIVDMSAPGVEVSPITDMTGAEQFNQVTFTDVAVPGDRLVGERNASFGQLMAQMEHERGGIDRLVSNRALYRDCLADTTLDDDPVLRQETAGLESGYRIGRLLVLRETLGQAPPNFSAATKTFCTEFEQRVAHLCARMVGPEAMLWREGLGGRVARNLCYAPGYTIMGGTTQILRNVIGERVLGLPREPRHDR